MKTQTPSILKNSITLAVVLGIASEATTAPFVNLELDQPILDNVLEIEEGYFTGPAADLLNGWELRLGDDLRNLVMYLSTMRFVGASPAELHPSSLWMHDPVVRDGFTLQLVTANQAGIDYGRIRLSQMGDIPTEADVLRIFISALHATDRFTIRIDGVEAPFGPDPQEPLLPSTSWASRPRCPSLVR